MNATPTDEDSEKSGDQGGQPSTGDDDANTASAQNVTKLNGTATNGTKVHSATTTNVTVAINANATNATASENVSSTVESTGKKDTNDGKGSAKDSKLAKKDDRKLKGIMKSGIKTKITRYSMEEYLERK